MNWREHDIRAELTIGARLVIGAVVVAMLIAIQLVRVQ